VTTDMPWETDPHSVNREKCFSSPPLIAANFTKQFLVRNFCNVPPAAAGENGPRGSRTM